MVKIQKPYIPRFDLPIKAQCSHMTKRKVEISALGETRTALLLPFSDEVPAYCPNCIAKMTIKCWHCGQNIFINDIVGISKENDIEKINYPKEHTVVYDRIYQLVVGCYRKNCLPLRENLEIGTWQPPGLVVFDSNINTVIYL